MFKNRKIRVGPRGGKYILRGGKKVYLSGGKGCSKYRSTKDPKCNEQEGCKWVKGQGCKSKSQKKEFRAVSRTPTSRTWLGGVVNIEKAKYIKTTAKKVKQAIEDLIEAAVYPSPAKVSVKPYKSTKYFEIHVDIEDGTDEDAVDYYFDEDQHNQYIYINYLFPSSDVAIEIVDPYLTYGYRNKSVPVKKAEKQMEEILQDVYTKKEKPAAKPKMVCDGNKCRRVPTKKSTAKKSKSVTGNDFIELALSRLDDNNGELEEKYRYWNDNNGNKFKIVRVVEFGSSRGDTYIEFYESENFTLGTERLGFSYKKFSGRDILYRSNKTKFSQEKPPKKGKKKSAKKDGRK